MSRLLTGLSSSIAPAAWRRPSTWSNGEGSFKALTSLFLGNTYLESNWQSHLGKIMKAITLCLAWLHLNQPRLWELPAWIIWVRKGASYIDFCVLFILYHPRMDLVLSFKNTSQKFDKRKTKHQPWPPLCFYDKCQLARRDPVRFFYHLEKRSEAEAI